MVIGETQTGYAEEMPRQSRDNSSRYQSGAESKYELCQNEDCQDGENAQHRGIPGRDDVQERFRRGARAGQPGDQSQQPVIKRRSDGIRRLSENGVGVYRHTPGKVPDQVFRHAHVIPRVGFLEVDEAGLKHQIETRQDSNGKCQKA